MSLLDPSNDLLAETLLGEHKKLPALLKLSTDVLAQILGSFMTTQELFLLCLVNHQFCTIIQTRAHLFHTLCLDTIPKRRHAREVVRAMFRKVKAGKVPIKVFAQLYGIRVEQQVHAALYLDYLSCSTLETLHLENMDIDYNALCFGAKHWTKLRIVYLHGIFLHVDTNVTVESGSWQHVTILSKNLFPHMRLFTCNMKQVKYFVTNVSFQWQTWLPFVLQSKPKVLELGADDVGALASMIKPEYQFDKLAFSCIKLEDNKFPIQTTGLKVGFSNKNTYDLTHLVNLKQLSISPPYVVHVHNKLHTISGIHSKCLPMLQHQTQLVKMELSSCEMPDALFAEALGWVAHSLKQLNIHCITGLGNASSVSIANLKLEYLNIYHPSFSTISQWCSKPFNLLQSLLQLHLTTDEFPFDNPIAYSNSFVKLKHLNLSYKHAMASTHVIYSIASLFPQVEHVELRSNRVTFSYAPESWLIFLQQWKQLHHFLWYEAPAMPNFCPLQFPLVHTIGPVAANCTMFHLAQLCCAFPNCWHFAQAPSVIPESFEHVQQMAKYCASNEQMVFLQQVKNLID